MMGIIKKILKTKFNLFSVGVLVLSLTFVTYRIPEEHRLNSNLAQQQKNEKAVLGDQDNAGNGALSAIVGNANSGALEAQQTSLAQLFNIKGQSIQAGDLIIEKSGVFYLAKNIVDDKNIKRHSIEAVNIDSNSITSRTIKNRSVGSDDLKSHLTIQHLTIDDELIVPGILYSISGAAHRISIGSGQNPTIDVASDYEGQSSITILGTITSGTWHGAVVN